MNTPATDIFVACHDCDVLYLVEPPAQSGPDGRAAVSEDSSTFAAAHATHPTSWLLREGEDTEADEPLWGPMRTLTFQATDGERQYIVIGRRESVDGPRTYRFTPGILGAHNSDVLVGDSDLRRGLDRRFFPQTLRPTKLDRFISLVHDIISHILPGDLEIAFEDAEDPAISVARLPTESYQELLTRCTEIFDAWEWPRVSRFLRDNRDADGLLALRVRRHLHLDVAARRNGAMMHVEDGGF